MRRIVFEPCIPTRGSKVPSRPDWIHEIKRDGYRLIVQRDGKRVRLFTRNDYDWRDRYLPCRPCFGSIRPASILSEASGRSVVARTSALRGTAITTNPDSRSAAVSNAIAVLAMSFTSSFLRNVSPTAVVAQYYPHGI